MNSPFTLYYVGDDPLFAECCSRIVKTLGGTQQAFAIADAFSALTGHETVGCLVIDTDQADSSGLELQRHLAREGGGLPCIFVAEHPATHVVVEAMCDGAVDFLEKPAHPGLLRDSIENALELGRAQTQKGRHRATLEARIATLTNRETRVFENLVRGRTNQTTADLLGISRKTVEMHRANLMRKMRCRSLAELILTYADVLLSASPDPRRRDRAPTGRQVPLPGPLAGSNPSGRR